MTRLIVVSPGWIMLACNCAIPKLYLRQAPFGPQGVLAPKLWNLGHPVGRPPIEQLSQQLPPSD